MRNEKPVSLQRPALSWEHLNAWQDQEGHQTVSIGASPRNMIVIVDSLRRLGNIMRLLGGGCQEGVFSNSRM